MAYRDYADPNSVFYNPRRMAMDQQRINFIADAIIPALSSSPASRTPAAGPTADRSGAALEGLSQIIALLGRGQSTATPTQHMQGRFLGRPRRIPFPNDISAIRG